MYAMMMRVKIITKIIPKTAKCQNRIQHIQKIDNNHYTALNECIVLYNVQHVFWICSGHRGLATNETAYTHTDGTSLGAKTNSTLELFP